MTRKVLFTVLGNPQSKANSRRAVVLRGHGNGRLAFIKSKSALEYLDGFKLQCPNMSLKEGLMEGDVGVVINIWYQSGRSDLDESIILDAMQGLIYSNDRQVKRKLVEHMGIDKENPRAEICAYEIEREVNGKEEKNKGRVRQGSKGKGKRKSGT